MKKLLVGIVLPALVITPLVASAQTQAPARDTRSTWRNDQGLTELRNVIGMRVKNEQGKDVGEVDNLLIDPQSGKISHVVIGLGGFMGVGEKKVVVPWSELKVAMAADGKKPTATLDQAKLESAPRWGRTVSADRDRTAAPAASPKTTK